MSQQIVRDLCPAYAPIIGSLGLAAGIGLTCIGSAYGTAKSALGIISVGVMHPEMIMRLLIPALMAGIVAIYGFAVAMLMMFKFDASAYSLYAASTYLAAGLSVGFAGLASGFAVGVIGDVGVRAVAQQPRVFVGMVLILIFAEVIGMYGGVIGLILCIKLEKPVCS